MKTLAWANISLDALQNNYSVIQQASPHSRIMAVIKADAYGHGSIAIAKALSKANALAVARIDEAIELRQHNIDASIVVLSGAVSAEDFGTCVEFTLEPVIHSLESFHKLPSDSNKPLTIWLKVDTGMHRLGLNEEELSKALTILQNYNHIHIAGLMSHLANAELIHNEDNKEQQRLFEEITRRHPFKTRSLANSASILFHPSMHYEWVRPGIMLYGSNPSELENQYTRQLKPVMTLKSRIIAIKSINSGEKVGYNGTWEAKTESDIAIVAIGYADGYPRHAANGTPVLINGKTYPLAGRVSMDLITVDVSNSEVKIGDEVTLWGEGLPANVIAKHAGTISYDLFTGITQRVNKVYL